MNVFYLELTHSAPVTVNDLKDIADYVAANWLTNFTIYLPNTTTLTQVDVRFIPSLGNELRYTGTYSDTCTGGTAVNDASACYVLSWVISAYYRGGHPRTYMPGIPTAFVTNGSTIAAGDMSGIVANANAWRNGINAHTTTNVTAITMGTVSFQRANAWLAPPVFEAYTSVKAGNNSRLGSQRRRINA